MAIFGNDKVLFAVLGLLVDRQHRGATSSLFLLGIVGDQSFDLFSNDAPSTELFRIVGTFL